MDGTTGSAPKAEKASGPEHGRLVGDVTKGRRPIGFLEQSVQIEVELPLRRTPDGSREVHTEQAV